jgi:pyrroline-5-carboxylate reductase
MSKKTLALIGAGNMGAAILEGLLVRKYAAAGSIWVYDKIAAKAGEARDRWKVHAAATAAEAVRAAGSILLAVKPQDLAAVLAEVRSEAKAGQTWISILAGVPRQKIMDGLGTGPAVVRAMPNLGAKVGEAVTALTGPESALAAAEEIFACCGKTVRLAEEHFDLVTALSGSGPAYFFLLMEMMAQAGVENGLSPEAARLLAVQTAVGAGLMAQREPVPPAELRRMVTSKGGTTEAALKVLEDGGWPRIFGEAVRAALKRGRELSRV